MSASSKKKLRKEQESAQLTEKQLAEQKEAKKLKGYTIGFVALIAVVLCAAIVVMVSQGISNSGIIERNTTAVQINDHKLSTADLSYYYVDTINNMYSEWNEYYGDYAPMYVTMMYGLDMTKSLNEQYYDTEGKVTWAEYCANVAVGNAKSNYALYDLAVEAGHELTEDEKVSLESELYSAELYATLYYGFTDMESYLKAVYGAGSTEKSYEEYMNVSALAASYYKSHQDSLEYDDAAIRAYDAEHSAEFNSYSYASYLMLAKDFLTGGTTDSDGKTTYSDEENAAALKAAQDTANTIAAGSYASYTEMKDAICALDAYKEETSLTLTEQKDVLYSDVNSKLVEWVSDSSRKTGDVGVVPYVTSTNNEDGSVSTATQGYYVIMFQSSDNNAVQLKNVRHILSQFEGGTTDQTTGETVYTESEKLAAKTAIEDVQSKWQANGGTEEAFKALVAENTDDSGSASTEGLYEDIFPGQMVPAFNDWCFDETRKEGDSAIVETEYGYHLMYFVGNSEITYRDYLIESTLRGDELQAWYDNILENTVASNIDISHLNLDITMQASNS